MKIKQITESGLDFLKKYDNWQNKISSKDWIVIDSLKLNPDDFNSYEDLKAEMTKLWSAREKARKPSSYDLSKENPDVVYPPNSGPYRGD